MTSYKLGKLNLKLYQRHSEYNQQKKMFMYNPLDLIYINIIGSPSAIIISKDHKLYFDNNLKFLVDIDFYIRLLKKTKARDFSIFNRNSLEIISSQDNKTSITKLMGLSIREIRKKKKKSYF